MAGKLSHRKGRRRVTGESSLFSWLGGIITVRKARRIRRKNMTNGRRITRRIRRSS